MIVMTAPRGTKYVRELAFAPTGLFAPGGRQGVLHWPEVKHGSVAVARRAAVRLVLRIVPSADGARVFAANDEVCSVSVTDAGASELLHPDTRMALTSA